MPKKIIFISLFFYLMSSASFAIDKIATDDALSKYDHLNDQAFIDVNVSSKKIHAFLDRSACIKTEKICYISSSTGISKFDLTNQDVHSIDNNYFSNTGIKPTTIYAKTSQTLYVGTNKGVYLGVKQSSGNYSFQYISAFGQTYITKLYVNAEDTIFAGTQDDGLFVAKKQGNSIADYAISDSQHYLQPRSIQYIYSDPENTMFVSATNDLYGSKSHVLWIKKPGENEKILLLPDNVVINSINNLNGVIKIGTDHGLLILNHDNFIKAPIFSGDNHPMDAAVYITSTGTLYAQTNQGFFKVKQENGNYKIMTHSPLKTLTPVNFCFHDRDSGGDVITDRDVVLGAAAALLAFLLCCG